MITGELKNKIDALWDIFAAGGLVNPLEVIEQITYLMFIHDLDDSDNIRAKESAMLGLPYQSIFVEEVKIGERTIDGSQLKWSVFHDFPADRMYSVMQEWVFPFIKTLHSDKNSAYSKYMDDAIFKLPTPLVLSKVTTLCFGILLGVFQLGLAYALLTTGIRYIPPVTASLITGIEPVLNPILLRPQLMLVNLPTERFHTKIL